MSDLREAVLSVLGYLSEDNVREGTLVDLFNLVGGVTEENLAEVARRRSEAGAAHEEDERIVSERDHLAMMRSPHLWPNPDRLPLKRTVNGRLQTSVLACWNDTVWLWWDNEFIMGRFWERPCDRVLDSERLSILVEQGWVVD